MISIVLASVKSLVTENNGKNLNDNTIKDTKLEKLISLIATQDKDALSELYELTNKSVYGFAYSFLKNPQNAQDVMQEVFIKIYSSASTYESKGKPMAWILTITKNLSLMKIRSDKRFDSYDKQEEDGKYSEEYSEDFSKDSENKIILNDAMNALSDEERQIVILHAMTGLKHREIAEITELNLSTVLSKYNRAIKKLREFLKESVDNER